MLLLLFLACSPGRDRDDGDDSGSVFGDSGSDDLNHDVLLVADNTEDSADEMLAVALTIADWLTEGMRVGITTTSANIEDGPTDGLDAGEAGTLLIAPRSDPAEVAAAVICQGIAWKESSIPHDREYTCGDAYTEASLEMLDCVCGNDGWNTQPGSGTEEGLESALSAACRSYGDMPGDCVTDAGPLTAADAGSHDFLRDGANLRIVIVSSEGDSSRRLSNGQDDTTVYQDAFNAVSGDWQVSVIGPVWDGSDGSCLNSSTTWGVERYQDIADASGGVYEGLTDVDDDCTPRDLGAAMQAIVTGF